jgi:hypothetical protein
MTLGALAELSSQQHDRFRSNLNALVQADNHLDLFEWVTLKLIERHLDERFDSAKRPITQFYSLNRLQEPLSILLSTIAYAGQQGHDEAAANAFELASRSLDIDGVKMIDKENCGLIPLESALVTLDTVAPRLKREVLKSVAICAGFDRTITSEEAELLRAIADMLGVPTPPLLPGQRLT